MCGVRGHRNGKTRSSLSITTMLRLTGRLCKVSQFLVKNSITVVPHTHPIWPPVTYSSSPSWSFGWRVEDWRDSRGIAAGTRYSSKKGLPGMLPSMAEKLGPLYSCKRRVLWRWWRNLTSKVSKLLFTSTVLELLGTSLYYVTLNFLGHIYYIFFPFIPASYFLLSCLPFV